MEQVRLLHKMCIRDSNIGVHPRWALQMGGGVWPDIEQVWLDSKEDVYKRQAVNGC